MAKKTSRDKHDIADGQQEHRRTPPLNIPLDFETAVEGLLGVDPKQLDEEDDGAKKKPDQK